MRIRKHEKSDLNSRGGKAKRRRTGQADGKPWCVLELDGLGRVGRRNILPYSLVRGPSERMPAIVDVIHCAWPTPVRPPYKVAPRRDRVAVAALRETIRDIWPVRILDCVSSKVPFVRELATSVQDAKALAAHMNQVINGFYSSK